MKVVDKLISVIFNIFVIVLAVSILLVLLNFVNYSVIDGLLRDYVFNASYKTIALSSTILIILAGLKVTIFSSAFSNSATKSIMINTVHGKMQINQDTIEDIAKNVIKDYSDIKDVQTRMTKAKNGINLYMILSVYPQTNIREVATRVQNDVKMEIENTTSVAVKNIDIKIKNVQNHNSSTKQKNKDVVGESVVTQPSFDNVPSTNSSIENSNTIDENVNATYTADTTIPSATEETYVTVQPTGEYKKDDNDVLYTVEANPNSTHNEQNN